MASIINADNGSVSGVSGLKYSADSSGVLVLQTNGTTALTIDTSQNVTFAGTVSFASGSFTNLSYTGTLTGGTGVINLGSGQFYKDSSGNVGIGVTPNSNWVTGPKALEVGPSSVQSGGYLSNLSSGGFVSITQNLINNGSSSYKYATSNFGSNYYTQGGAYYWQTAPSGTAGATVTPTTIMSLSQTGILDVPNRGISKGSMPIGSVLQTISTVYGTAFSTSSTSDTATGLAVTITPTTTSSKILITVAANARATNTIGNCYVNPALYRNGSLLVNAFAQMGNYNSTDIRGVVSFSYLDSPSSTSAVTYQLYMNSTYAATVYINNGAGYSMITAQEIAG